MAVRHCFARQNYLMLKRSRTGAYAPPHFYAVNHRQMILVRGCYNTILMCRQGTLRQMPQVLSIGQNKIVFQRSQPLRSKAAYYAAKSSFDDFRLRLLLHKQKRSRTGAYAPPHFYAVNHRQMILVRGCYNTILMCRQGTLRQMPQVLSIGQNKIVFQRSQPLRSKPAYYAAKSSFDDFRLRLL